ncbi:MAG: ACP S-malonyltransferase [Gammaproteobacteria bacterium]|nr:ACP S-malonyltransferase [Gammaproteobacteria bacterium]
MDKAITAFLFPGQGSQTVGMLSALAARHESVRQIFDEASEALGYDLWKVTQEGPEERLNQTEITQPALLAADVACYRVWRAAGGAAPAWMAGHSLGEYAALVCADAMTLREGAVLVANRGKLMQEAVPAGQGGMAAILGLEDEAVERLCAEQADGEVLTAVNYNAPGQVVIAGTKGAVDRAIAAARGAGAKRALPLAVSAPSHCALMKGAAERLGAHLAQITIRTPSIPVIHNCSVTAETDPEKIRSALIKQLYSPVRWVETIRLLGGRGVQKMYECGPGKVLCGLNKRIVEIPCTSLGLPEDMTQALHA